MPLSISSRAGVKNVIFTTLYITSKSLNRESSTTHKSTNDSHHKLRSTAQNDPKRETSKRLINDITSCRQVTQYSNHVFTQPASEIKRGDY